MLREWIKSSLSVFSETEPPWLCSALHEYSPRKWASGGCGSIRPTGSVLFEGAPPPDSLGLYSSSGLRVRCGGFSDMVRTLYNDCSVSSAREATRVGCLVSLIQWLLRFVLGLLGAILKLLGSILVAPARFIWRNIRRR